MGIPESFVDEMEPRVHSIIKKQLGFSEPSLLSAAMQAIKTGASKESLAKRLSALLDSRKASKLSDLICESVNDLCVQRDIPKAMSRKRNKDDSAEDEATDAKRQYEESAPMTTEQIRQMMANTLKELNERKKALANLKSNDPSSQKVPLPPPKVLSFDGASDKTKTIAALQAQIASRLNKLAPQIPAVANASALQIDRPTAVILDEKGRAVDDKGHEIQMHYEPTLKANMRAKKRDELRENLKMAAETVDQQDQEARFFDPRLAPKSSARQKRSVFKFVEPGKFQKEGQRVRMKAQLEKLQNDISAIARKTGIASATQLAKLAPRIESKDVPNVEWWDALILKNPDVYDVNGLRMEAFSCLIEHPIQMKPLESVKPNHVPVFLTKREMKKLRRQNRREAWKEKQDKIRLGMIQPDQPKVKMSNLMRVLGTEAVQDPTKIEAHVRKQMAERLANHAKANAERKLTPEQRKDKTVKKLKEDTSAGVNVAVYRLKNLSNPAKKFKVETNAKQLFMTGCVVLFEDVNVVVVEGGPKQQKKYKQLMMHRIKWDEDNFTDKEGQKLENRCELVWEGQTKDRHFGEMIFKQCPTESFAREHFKKSGVEHYWDLAYSGAILESTFVL